MKGRLQTQRRRWPLKAALLVAALAAGLAGCQSMQLPFGDDEGVSAEAAAGAEAQGQPEQQTAAVEAGVQGEPAGAPVVLQGPGAPPPPSAGAPVALQEPASGSPQVAAASGDEAPPADAGGQGSLADAAREGDGETRSQQIDKKPTLGSNLSRRFNAMFGTGGPATPAAGPTVMAGDVTGVWTLNEEDGLRVCSVTLAAGGANPVVRGPNCSGFVEQVTSWGLFGPELLLRDEQNTVLARLRQSGEGWVGFTVTTGIPVMLNRG